MTEIFQDDSRSPEQTESERLLRTIDNYVWGKTGVAEALRSLPPFKPSFHAAVNGQEGLWSVGFKSDVFSISLKNQTYVLSKQENGPFVLSSKAGAKITAIEASSEIGKEVLRTILGILNQYAAQIEQGEKASEARRRLKQTITKPQSPEQ